MDQAKPNEFYIIKRNHQGEEVWRYSAKMISRSAHQIIIEAQFNRTDLAFNGVLLKQNDRFVEAYFDDRWYNIYEIHDRNDDSLKAWYCNISRPAIFLDDTISFDDLALDLLVFPDGQHLVLDEEEFETLQLDAKTRHYCWRAMDELIGLAEDMRLSPLDRHA